MSDLVGILEKSFASIDVLDEMIDGFAMVDLSGRIVYSNRAFQSMLGYDREELGRIVYTDITPERWHEAEARILREEVLPLGSSRVYEKEYARKGGEVFPVELRTALVKDESGLPLGMWAIVRDISERKSIEDRLRESEEHFRRVFESSAIGMAIVEPSGRVVRANAALAAILGYSDDELLSLTFFDITHPDDRRLDWSLREDLLAGRRESFQIEKRYLRSDGAVIWCRLTASALRGSGPAGDLVIGMVEDVTQRRDNEERISRALEEKAVLLKEVHHRVKNNLQLVASMLDLQMSKLPATDEYGGVRGVLADAMGRVRSMASIHDIVYGSEDFAEIDFSAFMRSMASDLSAICGGSEIEVELELGEVRMGLDLSIPCGLFVNEAVTNIVKHAYPKDWTGPRPCLLGLKPLPGGTARISVIDRGVGIPEAQSKSGLGLTIMRALADQVRGRLSIVGGHGTSVVLEI